MGGQAQAPSAGSAGQAGESAGPRTHRTRGRWEQPRPGARRGGGCAQRAAAPAGGAPGPGGELGMEGLSSYCKCLSVIW